MRIFITGATGYIGGAVAAALRKEGHDVAALVRPDADSGALLDLGVVLVSGDLENLPSLSGQLGEYDAFVHTAQAKVNTEAADHAAVTTFNSLPGHFVYTSGVWVLGNTHDASEGSPVNPLSLVSWRPPHEELVIASGGAVLRPGCVYGGRQSLLADWFAAAEQGLPLKIVGDGKNHWAMVDLEELADLYVRAVEQEAKGVLHGIDESNATLNEVARAIAPEGTIEHVPLEKARQSLGAFADALAVDQKISSDETRQKTLWNPWRTVTSTMRQQWEAWRAR